MKAPSWPSIVTRGSGTGQWAITSWLIHEFSDSPISAITTVTDNGWNTWTLRKLHKVPAMWDVRNVLTQIGQALGDSDVIDPDFLRLLQYRHTMWPFIGKQMWNDHFLQLMQQKNISLYEASKLTAHQLWIPKHIQVLPASNASTDICATDSEGKTYEWERQVVDKWKPAKQITNYYHSNPQPALEEGISAVKNAELIVFCPWFLWTWLISNLLFEWYQEAFSQTHARIIYVCNVMTHPSQTHDFGVAEHLKTLEQYSWKKINAVFHNISRPPKEITNQYIKDNQHFVELEEEKIDQQTAIISDRFLIDYSKWTNGLDRPGSDPATTWLHYIRHDSQKIAQAIKQRFTSVH